jgi:hypothetical protein
VVRPRAVLIAGLNSGAELEVEAESLILNNTVFLLLSPSKDYVEKVLGEMIPSPSCAMLHVTICTAPPSPFLFVAAEHHSYISLSRRFAHLILSKVNLTAALFFSPLLLSFSLVHFQ